jgi:hypothetical protein
MKTILALDLGKFQDRVLSADRGSRVDSGIQNHHDQS